MRLLDLFCGRFGWSRAFAKRGWECVGIDLVAPPETPERCEFKAMDIFDINPSNPAWLAWLKEFDFIVASSPCEQFSVHGMKHFHPNPPYPELGIKLFNHTRELCEASGRPYVMENVRAAQQFVGNAVNHCGPFYLWGTGVPPLIHKGIEKGMKRGTSLGAKAARAISSEVLKQYRRDTTRGKDAALNAVIPVELSNCVADYAERILEVKV